MHLLLILSVNRGMWRLFREFPLRKRQPAATPKFFHKAKAEATFGRGNFRYPGKNLFERSQGTVRSWGIERHFSIREFGLDDLETNAVWELERFSLNAGHSNVWTINGDATTAPVSNVVRLGLLSSRRLRLVGKGGHRVGTCDRSSDDPACKSEFLNVHKLISLSQCV